MKKSELYYVVKTTLGLEIAVNQYDIFVQTKEQNPLFQHSRHSDCPWKEWQYLKRLSDQKCFYFSPSALKTKFFTTKCLKTVKILYKKR